jgi:hypothetical protein
MVRFLHVKSNVPEQRARNILPVKFRSAGGRVVGAGASAAAATSYSMGVGAYGDDDEPLADDDDVIDELFLNNFKQSTSNSVNAANAKLNAGAKLVTPPSAGRNPGGYDLDLEKVELANMRSTGPASHTRSPAATFAWPNK